MTGDSGPRRPDEWQAPGVKALRGHMGVSQKMLADELGVRQQTISEWETGAYRPMGASARLLTILAERAGFKYDSSAGDDSIKIRTEESGLTQ